MTRAKISQYSATAGDNTDVNGVNIAEGCPPSGINDAIREVMGALKRFETGSDGDSITVGGNLVVSGSTTANTLSTTVLQSDTISEKTSAAGVTVDGVLLKDSGVVTGAGTVSAPVYSTTGDTNTGIYFPAADNIGFATNGVIRGRWTNDGLCFNADTAAANALDDYEEGTWTPTLTAIANCSSLSLSSAWYIKIGGLVTYTMAGSITVTSANTKTTFRFTQAFAQSSLTDPQCGSAMIEGPNPFPYAAGTVIDASGGSSEGFAAFGASAVDFNGASSFIITGCFKAA